MAETEQPKQAVTHHAKRARTGTCWRCKQSFLRGQLVPVALLRPALSAYICEQLPGIGPDDLLCHDDLAELRAGYVARLLEKEHGEISHLEAQVLRSLADNETLAEDVERSFSRNRTLGEKLADGLASFGGSWNFIILFGVLLLVWIAFNLITAGRAQFDPYPFILLNLVLSCLAALQAPVIMMSQKRLEARDRARAENDFRVNLKAELEIRHLHEKLDHLLTQQWERLAEIQEIQIDLLEAMTARKDARQD